MTDDDGTRARAASFALIGQEYHRVRPGYPDDAVDWLLPAGARDVLDLGAGTGRLTDSLVARGLSVAAVDPSESMLGVLRERHPGVRCLVGTSERLDLPDASLDAVVVGQAWHWMEPATASAEAARVLRPGGTLGMAWNTRLPTGDWRDEFDAVQDPVRGAALLGDGVAAHPVAPFGLLEVFETTWERDVSPEDFMALYFTHSNWLIADEATREQRVHRWRELLDSHAGDTVREHYTSTAWRARLV